MILVFGHELLIEPNRGLKQLFAQRFQGRLSQQGIVADAGEVIVHGPPGISVVLAGTMIASGDGARPSMLRAAVAAHPARQIKREVMSSQGRYRP